MYPTLARLARRALTPKRGNKDFYKGTRQAALPGGHRTGAPGRAVVRGRSKYRLCDERVRVFVGPSVDEMLQSDLKPYVHVQTTLSTQQRRDALRRVPLLPGTPVRQWRREAEAGLA